MSGQPVVILVFTDDSCPPVGPGCGRGHEKCYQCQCLFTSENCPQCKSADLMASPALSVKSLDPAVVYGRLGQTGSSARIFPTPPVPRRPGNYRPSPAPGTRRINWIQRYNRRPNTVNIDDKSISGNSNPLYVPSSQLYNKLTSSIALLRSQVLGSLPEHEILKLRSIWVLGITWFDYNLALTECCFCFLFYFQKIPFSLQFNQFIQSQLIKIL